MKKKAFIALVGWLFLLSCHDEESLMVSLGDNYINSQTNVALIDTIQVLLSTVKIDSVPTSESDYLLSGSYTDTDLGKISATGYAQIGMPSADIDDDEIFDSIVICMNYSGMAYGDTLLPQTIKVHRVREDIEPSDEYDEEPYLYNTTKFKYDETPLGSTTVVPKPNFHDTIAIRLNDELGLEFLSYLRDEDDELETLSEFLEYFQGVALVPGDENNSILSFDADSSFQIKVYTHIIEEVKKNLTYTFNYESTSQNHFNNVTNDVSGMPLEQLTTQKEAVSSNLLDKRAYLLGSLGYTTRIDFPGITQILEVEYKNILYNAELVLKPLAGTYKNQGELPEELLLYYTDKRNNVLSELTDDDGYSIPSVLYYDEFYNESTQYIFDITNFIYNELSDGYVDPEDGLLVMLPDTEYGGTLNNVVFDARTLSNYRPTLNLYYVFYE
ncbi:DUF4270 family protein [Draconibacterium sp. IB214405]|uniref:DUF4270 family protein n=1 Tax=Draconibacterium sp. IB214405 TaxID=3097352 RepID=UPI002A1268C4|nr:DUF4270 family protein [Draconibacterium sp. IB214405]MDX8339798.1 DUF4270 family protein [Draconibacterium sp. IB214405]